ncbi:I78 family peptidase inhibitor [Sphingomonas sp. CFBP8993]|uniref:I78 family peptidase inhibitor n=1 Tax=Sphingomonas sp. CFBP8993 TaxID=3096526 RepID=UPI002A6B8B27|nr:I78 family peptidase inhibitor [Sphingomonas sp. CFBP8993]MDY0957429.1 I78 family peptidase inhibitor [Sphingomonas sp. CFBP8993]
MIRLSAMPALIGLAACAPMTKSEQNAGSGACGDARVAHLVGKVWSESLRAQILKTSSAASLRVIAPGTVVTMDYRPDRLNIETDDQGRVTRLRCG